MSRPTECLSHRDTIASIIGSLPGLRKLYVGFTSEPSSITDLTECWSRTTTIRELEYSSAIWPQWKSDFSLDVHVRGLPNLHSLWFDIGGNIVVPPLSNHPLLPKLTNLTLGSVGLPLSASRLVALLSHCPKLQHLVCLSKNYVDDTNSNLQSIQLQHLTSIIVDRELPLKFFISLIRTPALREFKLHESVGKGTIDFIKINPRITDLHIAVRESSSYIDVLEHLTNLQTLSVIGTGPGTFLRGLYSPPATCPLPVCASTLQRLKIVILRDELQPQYFEELVKTWFLPINKEGFTSAGCRALPELELLAGFREQVVAKVRECALWKRAKIHNTAPSVFILHWEYDDATETG
ncbi:hypothetical protein FRC17_003982 [Serendipita sp. 399]|nr:hypothetical protein FRC17_003982 [Serendipita sp. 399]